MRFGPVQVEQAEGLILGHNIVGPDGRKMFKKGRFLTAEDVRRLSEMGRQSVYAARLDPGDVREDEAAQRIAEAVTGSGIQLTRPVAGRVNLVATTPGVLRMNADLLGEVNSQEGITLATLREHSAVQPRQIVATVKIVPFAVPGVAVEQIESLLSGGDAVISVIALHPKKVGLILSGTDSAKEQLVKSFENPLSTRVKALGSQMEVLDFVSLEDEYDEKALAECFQRAVSEGYELIILAGETAIMDRYDIAPRGVERAGGSVECVGVPVDPGNLLMLGYIGNIPVLGAPGCARSLKTNAIDWILPPLLAGLRVTRVELAKLGHGGLLEDTAKRPMPRNRLV